MGKTFFRFKPIRLIRFWIMTSSMLIMQSTSMWGQTSGEWVAEELARMGFENVRWTENENERIYTIENNLYRLQGVGIAHAISTIQQNGLPENKRCKVIVTKLEVPEISITYEPTNNDSSQAKIGGTGNWETSYELGDSWKEVKKEKKKNSSRFKADILIYPQLSFQNMDITKIYQAMFSLNPALEISLWKGMKFTGQIILPLYVDTEGYSAYSPIYKKVRPGFITLSQRFRLPYNIKGKATVGYFNSDQYGIDLQLFYPFKDERFSLEGRLGYTGWGYWKGFNLKYNEEYQCTWSVGGNFYWPQYNTQFSLKAEQYLLGEKGVRFDMIRHFRYTSIGFYAMKGEHAKSNGGFRFQVALPPYKYKRHKYLPRISTSANMGIIYNAGNEQRYYRQYRAESSDNIMEQNSLNPIYIKSELENKLSN